MRVFVAARRWQLLCALGCVAGAIAVFALSRSDVPATSDLPLAHGLRILAAVGAGNQVDSTLPGHWQFIAITAPSFRTGQGAIVDETHLLIRDGWTNVETYVVPSDSDVVTTRRVPLGTPGSTTELDDLHRHINVVLSTAAMGGGDFPQPLWNNRAIATARSHNDPVLEAQLGNGPHN